VLKSRDLTSRRHETRQHGTRSNRDFRAWLNRGDSGKVVLDGPRTKICHSVKYSPTCDALYPPQDSIYSSPTWKQPCTNDVVAHNRCCQRLPPKPTLQQSLGTARGQWFLPRGCWRWRQRICAYLDDYRPAGTAVVGDAAVLWRNVQTGADEISCLLCLSSSLISRFRCVMRWCRGRRPNCT